MTFIKIEFNFSILSPPQRKKSPSEENPWEATTLEWATASPPLAHGNFETEPVVYHPPYEYNVPVNGHNEPYVPQHKKVEIRD